MRPDPVALGTLVVIDVPLIAGIALWFVIFIERMVALT